MEIIQPDKPTITVHVRATFAEFGAILGAIEAGRSNMSDTGFRRSRQILSNLGFQLSEAIGVEWAQVDELRDDE